ncbi:MAG: glutamate 5-kinase [Acidimicrobiia bacterium]|nr:glutamate 5-kinase [Acidimicrobiia bacterium]
MRQAVPLGKPVVVKIGSSSLSPEGGGLDASAVERIVGHVVALWDAGHPTVLVTSAAVAAGLPALGLRERPADLPGLQVAAAVGQGRLMERYANVFARSDRVVGQVLLTRDVLARREQYLHARDALERMLSLGVVPVVNENDTVVVDELKLGDNDRLAAIVSHLVDAGMLIVLTDTAGLYRDDPRLSDDAELLTAVRHTDEVLDELRRTGGRGALGSGGVATKVSAARMAAWSGIPTVIASASEPDVVRRAVIGDEVGTWVNPHESRLGSRKLWIAFGLPSLGTITIDDGAATAVVDRGKSLLAAGVRSVTGDFEVGDAVEVMTNRGGLLGKGLAGLSSGELQTAMGRHSAEVGGEAIHRDDLVVLVGR